MVGTYSPNTSGLYVGVGGGPSGPPGKDGKDGKDAVIPDYTVIPGLPAALAAKRTGTPPSNVDLLAGTSTTAVPAVSDVYKVAFPAPGLNGLRSAQDRAGDYMYLADVGASFGSIPARLREAERLLNLRGGGYIDLGTGSLDFGTENYTILSNHIKLVGSGRGTTKIIGSNQYGDILCVGDGIANPSEITLAGFRVSYLGPGTSGNVGIHIRNAYECLVDEVDTEGAHGTNLRISGATNGGPFGGNTYNIRVRRFKNYDGLFGIVLGGIGSIVQAIYLDDCGVNGKAMGIQLLNVSALFMTRTEVLGGYQGLVANPGTNQVVSNIQATDCTLDTTNDNLLTLADNGGIINGFTWQGSSILSGKGAQAILINGSALQKIEGIRFIGVRMGNSLKGGVTAINVNNLSFTECSNDGNNVSNTGGVGYYFGNGCTRCFVRGGSARGRYLPGNMGNASGWTQNQNYGVTLDGNSDYCGVIGAVDLSLNTTGPLNNSSTGTHNFATNYIN